MQSIRSRFTILTTDLPPTYWYLWLGILINRLGSFVIPFLTLYLTTQRGVSISQAALTVSLFGAGSFVAQLAGGELADRLGRRPVLLMSLFIAPMAMIALGFTHSLPLISFFTLVLGFFTDLYRPALNAAVADVVPSSARTRAFGYQNWAVNLGFSLAPILAGFMAHYNYLLLFIGDALTTFVFGLIVLARIPETRPAEATHAAHTSLNERIQQVRREPLLLAFSALSLFIGMIYMQGYVTLPLDMQAHGLTSADFGMAIASNGILIVAFSIQVSNAASSWPRFRAMAIAVLFLGIGFGLNVFARDLLIFYFLTVAVWTVGEITASAVAPALIADLSPIELRGVYQGIYGSSWGLSLLIGPILGGWVYEHFGPTVLWPACFILGCILALGYLWMGNLAGHRNNLKETSVMDKKYTAKVTIKINAPSSKVWDALTKPELIKQYLFGTDVTTDWRVGSPITYKGVWEGKPYEDKGKVLQVEKGRLLVSTFWSSLAGQADIPENYQTVTYELSAEGSGTKLTLSQDNNNTPEEAGHSEQNWNMVLEEMKKMLEA